MVITCVAAKMPDRISRLVHVDATLPDPGAAGGCDPMSFDGLEPVAPYAEKLQFDATYPSSGGLNSHIKSRCSCWAVQRASAQGKA